MVTKQTSPAVKRFSVWLLAGASALTLSSPAGAEPGQPFWMVPSVLADSSLNTQKNAPQPMVLWRQDVRPASDLNFFLKADSWPRLSSLEFSDAGPVNATSFRARSAAVALQPSLNSRVARLAEGVNFTGGAVDAQVMRIDSEFLGGRFKVSSDMVDSDTGTDRRDFRDPQLREQARDVRLQETSRRHRFAAKLIDSGNLKLMVDGEIGQISESFANNFRELPNGQLVLPGSWSNLSTRLEFGRTNVSVGYQDFETRSEARKREQVVLGFASSELQIYRRAGSEFNLINGGQWLKRTTFSGINADVIVADVLPDAIADAIDPIRPFLPTSINAGFERGDVVRAEFTAGPRDKVSTANVALTWNTRLGETTASAWQRKINTDLITPGVQEGVALSSSSDRYVDLSHSVRKGNWKFGAGLSLIQTDDEVLGVKSSGSEVAPHISIAYEPERGPKIELRFGAADAQSQLVDDNLAARARTRQLQLSVDVSDYVREELNRPDAKLKLEYRYDFSGGERDTVNGRGDGSHALLVTFSTPLN